MATKAAIKLMNWKSIDRLQKTAAQLSAKFNIEPFQLNAHTKYTRDPELIATYQLEDIANWAERFLASVNASSAESDTTDNPNTANDAAMKQLTNEEK